MNNSYNASTNSTDTEDIPSVVKHIVFSLILIWAGSGNIFVIVTISKLPKKSITNILILNLAICDLILVLASIPLSMVEIEYGFIFSHVGCKIFLPVATYSVIAASFTLVLFSAERYTAICRSFGHQHKRGQVIKTIIVLHITAVLSVVPYAAVLRLDPERSSCEENWSKFSKKCYTVFLFITQYGIPLPLIITLNTFTWLEILAGNNRTIVVNEEHRHRSAQSEMHIRRTTSRMKQLTLLRKMHSSSLTEDMSVQRRCQTLDTLKMFLVVIIVYATCMLPNQVTWMVQEFGKPLSKTLTLTFYWMAYTNSALNPWIYGGINSAYRRAYFKSIWHCIRYLCGINCAKKLTGRTSLSSVSRSWSRYNGVNRDLTPSTGSSSSKERSAVTFSRVLTDHTKISIYKNGMDLKIETSPHKCFLELPKHS